MTRPLFLALALAAVAVPAAAATDVTVPRFEGISLHGGGKVTIRKGATQKVTIVSGDASTSSFEVANRSLRIDACDSRCPENYRLVVVIVTPDVEALAISGGGSLTVTGFSGVDSLALSVSGGGGIDTRAVEARQVAASVRGGGSIRTWATKTLAASVHGGGGIIYRGEPEVATAVRGGGSVKAE